MPWFGQTISSGTTVNITANTKFVSKFTLDLDGTLTSISFASGASTTLARAVIYDASGTGGLPGALLGVSSEVSGLTSATWNRFPFSSGISLTASGGPYWIGLWANTTNGSTSCPALTNGIATNTNTYSSTGSPSNPFGASPTLSNFVYPVLGNYDIATSAIDTWRGYPSSVVPSGSTSGIAFIGSNQMYVVPVNVTSATINNIRFNIGSSANTNYSTVKVKGVIYSNSTSGTPGTLLGTSNELVGVSAGNVNTLTFASAVNVSGHATIWIGIITDTGLTSVFSSVTNIGYTIAATYTSGPPSTFGSGTATSNLINIWTTGTFTTTAALLSNVARQALYSTGAGTVWLAGLARQALISGVGIDGSTQGASSARGVLSLAGGGVSLGGHITATSRMLDTTAINSALVSARAKGTTSARGSANVTVSFGGRIKTAAEANILPPGRRSLAGHAGAQSEMRATLSRTAALGGRAMAMAEMLIQPLPTRVNMIGRISGKSRASIYSPIPVNLVGGRITAQARSQLYVAAVPKVPGEAITMHVV